MLAVSNLFTFAKYSFLITAEQITNSTNMNYLDCMLFSEYLDYNDQIRGILILFIR